MILSQGPLGIYTSHEDLGKGLYFCSSLKHLFSLLGIWVAALFFVFNDLGNFQVSYEDRFMIYSLNL